MAEDIGDILDDVDDVTARLIVELQFEDSVRDRATAAGPSNNSVLSDFELARTLYAEDLCEYRDDRWRQGGDEDTGNEPTYECIICEDEMNYDGGDEVPCGHSFCWDCLDNLFRTALTGADAYPPRCCQQIVDFENYREELDSQLAQDFAAKKPELDDPQPVYCPQPECSTYIPQANRHPQLAFCPRCSRALCMCCKQTFHYGNCPPDAATQQVLDLAADQGWQPCPSCRTMVELRSGCYHISCRCKAEFCYLCRALWKNCNCPQFNEERLVERGHEALDRQIADDEDGADDPRDLEGMMNQVAQNHDCADHRWRSIAGEHVCDRCEQEMPTFIYQCRNCNLQCCRRCRFTRA